MVKALALASLALPFMLMAAIAAHMGSAAPALDIFDVAAVIHSCAVAVIAGRAVREVLA